MKKALILTALCLMAVMAMARPVSQVDALRVATCFWQGKGELRRVDWQYSHIYLFVGEQGGFVMVSADDCARPVIAYSSHGLINPEALPVQLSARMEDYNALVADGMRQQVAATDGDAALWQLLLKGGQSKDGDRVGPLLETRWHQDGGYALLTPQHTPTGCAATAQSQVMRYWNYPAFGRGSETYNCHPYGAQSADFAHTLYDWGNMPVQVTTASPYVEQIAVSTLMYHVGVSLHMGYAEGGSGAAGLVGQPGTPSIDNSLKDYFYYSQLMRPIFKTNGYTDERWADSLVTELNLQHPIVYCGVAPEGGHGFVCDGYEYRNGRPYFHFNFGWSGNGDGYYTTDDICPNVSPTGEVGSTYHFNQSNQALLGAVPDYRMHVSDSLLTFTRDGGEHQLLFCSIDTSVSQWNVCANQPWVIIETNGVEHVGAITIAALANTTGDERQATITFTQDGESICVTVVQTYYSEADYCPLTVVMESTRNGGWENGAYLSFESLTGYVYNIASLSSGGYDSVLVGVPPHDVNMVFHHGGGTDRYINYRVYNQHGEQLANVEYAFMNGGSHFIEWPCASVAIDKPADEPQVLCTEVYDISGRRLTTTDLPSGIYIVRTITDQGIVTKKIVKP